jgi:hypothetical protein
MKIEDKIEVFKNELKLIDDMKIRNFVTKCVQDLPDYFFEIPASSTGKYHPKFSLGDGGLVRHTKCAVDIAIELFKLDMFKSLILQKPYVIGALILHDGLKSGKEKVKYTVHDHPKLISDFIMYKAENEKERAIALELCALVESHMGQWRFPFKDKTTEKYNTSNGAYIELMECDTSIQKFVHICDYMASRKLYDKYYGVSDNG